MAMLLVCAFAASIVLLVWFGHDDWPSGGT